MLGLRARVLRRQLASRAQRHQALEVGDRADAAKVVIAREARAAGAVDQPEQRVRLRAERCFLIELGAALAGAAAQKRLDRATGERRRRQRLQQVLPTHGTRPLAEGSLFFRRPRRIPLARAYRARCATASGSSHFTEGDSSYSD